MDVLLLPRSELATRSRTRQRRTPALLPAAFLVVLASMQGFGQVNLWTSRGPEGGYVGVVIDPQHPNILYASSGTAAFKSTDTAAHWVALDAGSVRFLAVNANIVYGFFNNWDGGLQKSADGGITWTAASLGLPCIPSQLAFDPRDSHVLYAALNGTYGRRCAGIFKSTDGAASWTSADSGLPSVLATYGVNTLLIDPQNPDTLYASGAPVFVGGGVFKSTDSGESWIAATTELPPNNGGRVDLLAIDAKSRLYANSYNSNAVPVLSSSSDGGATWSTVCSGLLLHDLFVDGQSGTLYARGGPLSGPNPNAILKSTDRGADWSVIFANAWALTTVAAREGPSTLYALTPSGPFKSADGGTNWVLADSGLAATVISGVAVHPRNRGRVYAAAGNSYFYASQDGGQTWNVRPTCGDLLGGAVMALDPQDPDTVYLNAGGLCKSTDGGSTWSEIARNPPRGYVGVPGPLMDANGTIYFANLRITNSGASSEQLGMLPTVLAIDPRNPETLYASADSWKESALAIHSRVRKSLDAGRTWSDLDRDWHGYLITALAVDPTNPNVVYAETGGIQDDFADVPEDYYDSNSELARDGCCLFRSDDGGASWVKLNLPGYYVYGGGYKRLLGIDSSGAPYVQIFPKLMRSGDRGNTWNPVVTTGLTAPLTGLGFDPQDANHVFAATLGGGVFEIVFGQ